MLVSTTEGLEGHRISRYFGLVSGDAILGANIFKDYETIGGQGTNMLVVSANGTAVRHE
jgi:uncharacterized protein YbjQ (UPF0145 family)